MGSADGVTAPPATGWQFMGEKQCARRKAIVEPVFGQIKQARGFRQFLRRSIEKERSRMITRVLSVTASALGNKPAVRPAVCTYKYESETGGWPCCRDNRIFYNGLAVSRTECFLGVPNHE